MERYDICCLGHITLDKIVTPRQTVHMPGGTAYYFAHAMSHLDKNGFLLVTSLAESEMEAVHDIRKEGIKVEVIPSRYSVYFENKYGEDQNHRTQRVLAKADPFKAESLGGVEAKVYHLGTLLADDFSLDEIKYLSTKGKVSVDAQGYLREVRGEQVYAIDWPEKKEACRYIHVLKANESEAEVLTGHTDPLKAAEVLASWGVKEVILTLGDMGSMIYVDNKVYRIPAYKPKDVVDATGCGDTYMAGYLYMRTRGSGYQEAGRFAAAMCTLKLEASGPFKGTIEDIKQVIKNNEIIQSKG